MNINHFELPQYQLIIQSIILYRLLLVENDFKSGSNRDGGEVDNTAHNAHLEAKLPLRIG